MKFYTNEIPFRISSQKLPDEQEKGQYIVSGCSTGQIISYHRTALSGQVSGQTGFLFYVNNYQQTVKELQEFFEEVIAAGGIVRKEEGVLFIHRRGVWDLPKGKVEPEEPLETTAVREVEEECGVKAKIVDKLGETWHTYQYKGKHVLKCTHWYIMDCESDTQMKPQQEEQIEAVKWLSAQEAEQTAMPTTFNSIRDIYQQYRNRVVS